MNKREYEDKTISKIQKDQLNGASNNENIRAIAESTDYDNRKAIINEGSAYGADVGVSQTSKFVETARFAHEIDIDENAMRRNEKMKLNQKVDHI